MVNSLVGTGCRISTLINVRITNVDFDNAYVTFRHTRNKQPQINPLPQNLVSIIQDYLDVRQGTGEDYLFCSELGGQLHPQSASHAIMAYNRSRCVAKTSTHLSRQKFSEQSYWYNSISLLHLSLIYSAARLSAIAATKMYT